VPERIHVPVPLDPGRTLTVMEMWGATTWLRRDGVHTWYAAREASGAGTIRITRGDGWVEVASWGSGGDELAERVPELLGLHRPGLDRVEPHHPVVAEAKRALAGLRVGRSGQVYPRLVGTALAQKVTGPNGKGALRRLAWRFGERAPGPRDDLWLLPPPRQLARIPYYVLHELNIERHRAELIARIASRAGALQRAAAMGPTEARAHLQKLPGIGPWTSGVVAGGSLGDADAVPIGDAHLPRIVGYHLAGERDATDERMMELLSPYAGQRGLVARAVKITGGTPPRRTHKPTVRDIRDH